MKCADRRRPSRKTFAGDIKGEFIGSFSGIKSALVGAFGLGAAVEGLSALMEKYGKVQDMAERLGETAESVQRVGQVATESGTDVEMIAKAMSKLTVEANKATHAGTEQAAMFDTLGINAAEFRDAPLEGKLIVLADAWERNTATGEGTAQMLELLGNRAQQLIPLLIAGPEELRKKLAEVSVASNAAVGIIDQMGDAWSAVKNKGTAASAEVVRYGRYLLALNAASVRWLHGDLSGMRNLPGTWKGMRAEDKSFDTPKKRGTGADEKLAEIEAEQKAATEREKQHEKETKAVIADAEKIIERQRQLETELESLREKHRLAAMTDEERLAALREREKQLILAGGGTPAFQAKPAAGYVLNQYDRARATHEDLSPTAPLMDAREKALETGKEIERQEEEIAAKKKRLETEIARLTEDCRLAGMTAAQRLIALLEKQKKLIAEGWNPQIAKAG